jgi:hypothetical protein
VSVQLGGIQIAVLALVGALSLPLAAVRLGLRSGPRERGDR